MRWVWHLFNHFLLSSSNIYMHAHTQYNIFSFTQMYNPIKEHFLSFGWNPKKSTRLDVRTRTAPPLTAIPNKASQFSISWVCSFIGSLFLSSCYLWFCTIFCGRVYTGIVIQPLFLSNQSSVLKGGGSLEFHG